MKLASAHVYHVENALKYLSTFISAAIFVATELESFPVFRSSVYKCTRAAMSGCGGLSVESSKERNMSSTVSMVSCLYPSGVRVKPPEDVAIRKHKYLAFELHNETQGLPKTH